MGANHGTHALFLLPLAAPALDAPASDDARCAGEVQLTDANKATIKKKLEQQGYRVAKIKLEDGCYEAYARLDDQRYEVFLDGEFNIVRTEID